MTRYATKARPTRTPCQAAGNTCTYKCYTGQIHGFLNMARVNPQTFDAFDEVAVRQSEAGLA